MRLIMEGFKTYNEPTEFVFPSEGLTLLEGSSGKGKSTIFRAISWVLYGKERATYSWATSKRVCKVALILDNPSVTIERMKNPERLSVTLPDNRFESEEAQAWIDKQWGARNAWITNSYLMQSQRSLLLTGTNQEKLDLLEEWAFPHDKPSVFIDRFTKEKKKYQQELDALVLMTKEYTIPTDVDIASLHRYTTDSLEQVKQALIDTETRWTQAIRAKQLKQILEICSSDMTTVQQKIDDLHERLWNGDRITEYTKTTKDIESYYHVVSEMEKMEQALVSYTGKINLTVSQCDAEMEKITRVNQLKQTCTSIDATYDKAYLDAYIQRLSTIETYHDSVKKYKSYKTSGKDYIDVPRFTEEDIMQCRILTNTYLAYTKLCAQYKVSPRDVVDIQERYKDYMVIQNVLPAYRKWKQLSSRVEDPRTVIELHIYMNELYEKKKQIQVQGSLLSCPCCNTKLRMENNKLVQYDITMDTSISISDIDKELAKVVATIQDKNDLQSMYALWWDVCRDTSLYERYVNDTPPKDLAKIMQMQHIDPPEMKPSYMDEVNAWHDHRDLAASLAEVNTNDVLYDTPLKEIQRRKTMCHHVLSRYEAPSSFTLEVIKQHKMYLEKLTQYQILQKKITTYEFYEDEEMDLKERHRIIEYQNISKGEMSSLMQQKHQLLLKHTKYQNEYDEIKLYNVEELEQQVADIRADLTKHFEMMPIKQKYDRYQSLSQQTKDHEVRVQLYTELIEKTKILEHTLLHEYLTMLNTSLESVLGDMFEDPIHLSFELFKGERPSVQIRLIYKGNETDSVVDLSGGEQDRVSLAITMSLSMTSTFPYLLLDECFGSLDASIKEKCLDVLRKTMDSKPVLVIAHGETEGDYNEHHRFN